MFVTVHDSVGIDCPPEEIPEVPNKCLEIMTHLPFKWLFIDYKGKTEFNPKSVRDKGMLLYHEMNYKLPTHFELKHTYLYLLFTTSALI